jgi:hypothetical protein
MNFADFLNAVHQRYQKGGARIPFSDCFVDELASVRPDLVPKQRVNRRMRVTQEDFIRIRKEWAQ